MLKEVASWTNLQSLDLSESTVTNKGLEELSKSKSLKELELNLATLDNEGVKELIQLRQLRHLSLVGCWNLSEETILDLRFLMPNCEIADPNGNN
jgi:Ran GTPase-activating protein (RanGAP) involved in mRNA processing and transport